VTTDADSARQWLVHIGLELGQAANKHNDVVTALVNKIHIIAACAQLSDDMVIRIRLTPNVFGLEA
jgi:hypothetical protein